MAGMGMARDYYALQHVLGVLCQEKGHDLSVVRQPGIPACALSTSVPLSQKNILSRENDSFHQYRCRKFMICARVICSWFDRFCWPNSLFYFL